MLILKGNPVRVRSISRCCKLHVRALLEKPLFATWRMGR